MKKVNTKMKLLSLAILGLGGIALAGSASAACPASPDAWSSSGNYQGTLTIASGGLGGTSCRMDTSIQAGAGPFAFATVHDDSPSSEPSYRAQFIVDLDSLASPTVSTGVQIFNAASSGGKSIALNVFGFSGQWYVGYVVPDANSPSGVSTGSKPLSAGENRIEFDLQIGSSGSFTMWINSNSEGSPTVPTVTVNNSSLAGIDGVDMGLAGPTPAFISTFNGLSISFDQFDSRRQSFIGY